MQDPPEHLAEWCLADTDSPWEALSLAVWLVASGDGY